MSEEKFIPDNFSDENLNTKYNIDDTELQLLNDQTFNNNHSEPVNMLFYNDSKVRNSPLFQEVRSKYTALPILYPDVQHFYDKQIKEHWFEHELHFANDLNEWNAKLNNTERYTLSKVIAFFAAADSLVAENVDTNFLNEVTMQEAQRTYRKQASMEDVHAITYAKMVIEYITDPAEQNNIFNNIKNDSCVSEKISIVEKWKNDQLPFHTKLVAFILIEGIFFCGSFCIIYWFKNRGLLKELCKANEFIARDESDHMNFGIHLYNKYIQPYLTRKISDTDIHTIFDEMVQAEIRYCVSVLPENMRDLNSVNMIKYIKFTANRILNKMGHKSLYFEDDNSTIQNPFPFMNAISLDQSTDFFSTMPTEYSNSVSDQVTDDALLLAFDA